MSVRLVPYVWRCDLNVTINLFDESLNDPKVAEGLRVLMQILKDNDIQGIPTGSALPDTFRVSTSAYVSKPRERDRRVNLQGPSMTWEKFVSGLTPATRMFLTTLEEKKRLTIREAADLLGIPLKGIGGTVGSMTRKALNRGVDLPIGSEETPEGRVYTWTKVGVPADDSEEAPAPGNEAEVPADESEEVV